MSRAILVVEDDEAVLEAMRDLLQLESYDVRVARNGREALERLAEDLPALMLLDMRMPELDGWGVAAAVRERGWDVPIVVVTAADDAGKWASEISAAGFLSKPFDIDELFRTVEAHRRR